MNFDVLQVLVESWGTTRGLTGPDNSRNQLLKTMAELGELADATLKNNRVEMVDGLGDVLVTLILYASAERLDLVACLESAWQEIKNRTGETVNGVFIKD